MKKKSILALSLILALGLGACGDGQLQDFRDYPAQELVFEEMPIEPLLGHPQQIRIAGDSLLLINDHVEETALLLYNLRDSSYVRTVTIGQGPGEVTYPNWIDLFGDSLNVLSRNSGIVNRYALSDLRQNIINRHRSIDLKRADRITQTDDGFVAEGFYQDENEEPHPFRVFDANGRFVQDLDWYEGYPQGDTFRKYLHFMGQAGYHAGRNTLMVAPTYASTIWFYTRKGNRWEKSASFPIGDGKLEDAAKEGDYSDETRFISKVLDICTDGDYFYYLHADENMKGGRTVNGCEYVLRFRSDGTFDKLYKVDETVTAICPAGNVMYAIFIGKDGEYTIGKTAL